MQNKNNNNKEKKEKSHTHNQFAMAFKAYHRPKMLHHRFFFSPFNYKRTNKQNIVDINRQNWLHFHIGSIYIHVNKPVHIIGLSYLFTTIQSKFNVN